MFKLQFFSKKMRSYEHLFDTFFVVFNDLNLIYVIILTFKVKFKLCKRSVMLKNFQVY